MADKPCGLAVPGAGGGKSLSPLRKSSLFEIPPHPRMSIIPGSSMIFGLDPHMEESLHLVKKPNVEYENTYRMEPAAKFRADKVNAIIKDSLESHLENKTYDPIGCGFLAKTIVQEIMNKTKALEYDRYKFVAPVDIGERKEQGIRAGSRFLWDTAWDNYATGYFKNSHIFAVAMVYAVYFE